MLKNYFKIAVRNLLNNKIYTFINILGLSVGIACCILIMIHVMDELSYDEFHNNSENIYRVALERVYPDHENSYAVIPSGFSEAFLNELPEVQQATRLVGFPNFSNTVRYKDRIFEENYVFFADSNFFDLFTSLEILQGDARSGLENPNSVILTASMARKYFKDENPIGKEILVNGQSTTVTAVMQDIPRKSHLKFDFLASTTNVPFLRNADYMNFSSYTYIETVDGVSPSRIDAKIPEIVKKYATGQIERRLGVSYEEYIRAGNGYNYFLQPLESIHLHSNLESEMKPNGNITYVYIFVSISIFILLLAGINFVNLATARSTERAREVGVRKMMGSSRLQLVRQFLTESVFVAAVSLVLAIAIIQIALPYFNNLSGKTLEFTFLQRWWLPLSLIGITLVIGIVAGLYPALYISSLRPSEVLKGKFGSNKKGLWLRNGLVIFQFSIAIILISGTLVVYNQMDFIQNKRLGFNEGNVLVLRQANNIEQIAALKKAVRNLPEVVSAATSSTIPGGNFFGMQFNRQDGSDVLTVKAFAADDHYFETMKMNIQEGRSFSEYFNDSLSVVLNQAAVKAFGLENPVGMTLYSTQNVNDREIEIGFEVVGVVEDFNFESLHSEITPLAVVSTEGPLGFQSFMSMRIQAQDVQQTIGEVEQLWKSFAPGQSFLYSFLDTHLDNLYNAERRSGKIFGAFAFLAVIIACIGLFGLAAYMAYQRTKEIGVRKVLGATVSNIVMLLSKDFTKLVGVAFLIATPLAWLLMQHWLENFAYRIELQFQTFMIAGIITVVVSWSTIGYQAVNAALTNPVESLKDE